MFVRLPAWNVLINRDPDWLTAVTPEGEVFRVPGAPKADD
jgi:hypothetical protein